MAQRARRSRRRLFTLLALFLLWLFSITWSITRYGDRFTFTVHEGFIGLYWGGDASVPDSHLLNHFTPPSRPPRRASAS